MNFNTFGTRFAVLDPTPSKAGSSSEGGVPPQNSTTSRSGEEGRRNRGGVAGGFSLHQIFRSSSSSKAGVGMQPGSSNADLTASSAASNSNSPSLSPPPSVVVAGGQSNSTATTYPSIYTQVNQLAEKDTSVGGVKLVALLHEVPIIALVPSSTDRILQLYDLIDGKVLAQVQFDASILNVRINDQRLAVVCERTIHLFDWTKPGMPCITQNNPIQTFSPVNKLGLAVLSEVNKETQKCFIAFPQCSQTGPSSSVSTGEFFIVNALTAHQIGTKIAHNGPIQAMAISGDGYQPLIATASDKGTLIRVFDLPIGNQIYSFRRGLSQTTIWDLRFSWPMSFLAATASSGSVHIFHLHTPGAGGGDGTGGGLAPSSYGGAGSSLVTGVISSVSKAVVGSTTTTTEEGGNTAAATEDAEAANLPGRRSGGGFIAGGQERAVMKLSVPEGACDSTCVVHLRRGNPSSGGAPIISGATVVSKVSAVKKAAVSRGETSFPSSVGDITQGDTVSTVVQSFKISTGGDGYLRSDMTLDKDLRIDS